MAGDVSVLASAWVDGQRRAVVIEDERVGVSDVPGLDAAVAGGLDVPALVRRWVDLADVRLDAPLRPPVVFCLGQTYASHVREKSVAGFAADAPPREPEFFIKAGQTIATPGRPFRLDPRHITKLDYETELGVVIGARADRVSVADALDHVFGYLVVDDVTARERQIRIGPDGSARMAADAAKNFADATWFSSHVVPRGAVGDLGGLSLTTRVNGELRQDDTLSSLIFDVAELVSHLSHLLPLEAGAVIATGTPGGTGWSTDQELGGTGVTPQGCVPARYLRAGDVIVSEIEQIGSITTEIVPA